MVGSSEWSGEIVKIGAAVPGLQPGQRVMCSGNGGYAEYAVTDWGRVVPIPADTMSFEQAATLPIALQTMHDALVTNGLLQRGQAVLIQGAQLRSRANGGCRSRNYLGASLVIGTSTDAGRRSQLGRFGADLALASPPGGLAGRRAGGDGGARGST